MSLYNWLLTGHILAVIVWLGGGVWTQVYALRARAASDDVLLIGLARQAVWAGNRVFMPASVLTALFGVLLVVQGPWTFEQPWVALGILGFVATGVNGAAVLAPAGKRLVAAADQHGASSGEARALARRLLNLMTIDLAVVTLVVIDMVVKPGA